MNLQLRLDFQWFMINMGKMVQYYCMVGRAAPYNTGKDRILKYMMIIHNIHWNREHYLTNTDNNIIEIGIMILSSV